MPAPEDNYHKDVDFTSLALRYPDFAKKFVHLLILTACII